MDYIISDTHFNHTNILRFEKRPFQNVNEMNEFMIASWNDKITHKDRVFLLGDVIFTRKRDVVIDLLSNLNGKIIIILGNHDKVLYKMFIKNQYRDLNGRIYIAGQIYEPKVQFQNQNNYEKVVLSHYPIYSWNARYHGRKHFYGHVHSNSINLIENMFNVSADVLDFTPQTFDYVVNNQLK